MEKWARGLTVVSFVMMCWVVHRAVQVRTDCVNSSAINLVLIDQFKVYNCRYESRLSLKTTFSPLPYQVKTRLRAIESAERLQGLISLPRPLLIVEIVAGARDFFEIGRGYVRLGEKWLAEPDQLGRALTMGTLNALHESSYADSFEREMMGDFVALLEGTGSIRDELLSKVKFSTTANDFESYCKTPFRSLAHARDCDRERFDSEDLHARIAGFRPLLASALWRIFDRASLKAKIHALGRLRSGPQFPVIIHPVTENGATLALWFTEMVKDHMRALGLENEVGPFKRAMRELEVESPTHWELTVDVTKTPAWREILEQLRTRSFFRPKERTLVFTPDGAVALPSGLPVEWAANDISSQKHVMIGCPLPEPTEAVAIHARHIYAQKSCEKLNRSFWD